MSTRELMEYTCDACGAVLVEEGGIHTGWDLPDGWGWLSYYYEGKEGDDLYCPDCVHKQFRYIAYTPDFHGIGTGKTYEITPARLMKLAAGVPPEDVFTANPETEM